MFQPLRSLFRSSQSQTTAIDLTEPPGRRLGTPPCLDSETSTKPDPMSVDRLNSILHEFLNIHLWEINPNVIHHGIVLRAHSLQLCGDDVRFLGVISNNGG